MHICKILVLMACVQFVSCGRVLDKIRGKKDDTNQVAQGPLAKYVERLQTSKNVSDCDKKFRDMQVNLANVLDAKADEIAAFAATLPPSKTYKRVQLGPIFVRELNQPIAATPGWKSESRDWSEYGEYLKEIQNQPVDQSWMWLDNSVGAILVDDEDRLIYEANMYLSRLDYPVLQVVSTALNACLADPKCTTPQYNDAGAKLLASNPYYASFGADRPSLGKLKEWVDVDLKSTRKNDTIKAEANGDIILPLDPGPFGDVKDQLGKYITDVWATAGQRVRIRWTTVDAEPGTYKFVVGEGTGGRAFVSYKTKTVNLFADVRAKSIAHEIGHVLGFPDYYYTTWHSDTCKYSDEYSEDDLMSEATTGVVTSDEWQVLKKIYTIPNS